MQEAADPPPPGLSVFGTADGAMDSATDSVASRLRLRLRVSRSHFPVTALGPGRRLGVWVQGCPLGCRGCMSQDTWDPAGGVAVEVGALAERWQGAIRRGATGLTVSGGEPLAQPESLAAFLTAARFIAAKSAGEYDILLYTGYELEELDATQRHVVTLADALITGRYEAARPTRLIWRGSANQRLHPLTALGRLRYSARIAEESANPSVQLRVDAAGVWLIGVPQRGMLARLDRDMRAAGIPPDEVSWRRIHPERSGDVDPRAVDLRTVDLRTVIPRRIDHPPG